MRKLAIIGAGSMAEALIAGIVKKRLLDSTDIWVTNRSNKKNLEELKKDYGISITYDLELLLTDADAILLAMKPKDAIAALQSIRPYLKENTLIISVLAGVSIKSMERALEKPISIVRAMPNTSATIGRSATALAKNRHVSTEQSELAETIFQTVGITRFVKETQLDAVTGLSGSGPAYIYYLYEAMEKAAVELGLEREVAKEFILQTYLGAAEMLSTSIKSPEQLRIEVTSPGGTTEAGLKVLQDEKVDEAFNKCIKEAHNQSIRLGEAISNEMKSGMK